MSSSSDTSVEAGGLQKATNLQSYKGAVLLNKRAVQSREWKNFVIDHWDSLTKDLKNTTILWLAGRHGLKTGKIGSKDETAMDSNKYAVMSNNISSSQIPKAYKIYFFFS